jgi:hypothetical protein
MMESIEITKAYCWEMVSNNQGKVFAASVPPVIVGSIGRDSRQGKEGAREEAAMNVANKVQNIKGTADLLLKCTGRRHCFAYDGSEFILGQKPAFRDGKFLYARENCRALFRPYN